MRHWLVLLFGVMSAALQVSAQEPVEVQGRISVRHLPGEGADNSSVVVWLKPLATNVDVKPATESFRLVQKDKRFTPHLLVVPVGTRVEFPNLDPFFHNVFSLYEGKRFDLGLYEAGGSRFVRFTRPGVSYIFCNIHPGMSAVVVALATPYYAVTNSSGEYTMRGVMPGSYQLNVWYERAAPEDLAKLSRTVVVTGPTTVKPVRVAAVENPLPHQNKYGMDYDVSPPYEQGR